MRHPRIPSIFFSLCLGATAACAQEAVVENLGNGIFRASIPRVGGAAPQSGAFLVATGEGKVIVDTSGSIGAPLLKGALEKADPTAVRAIFVTHGHGDHIGGIGLWREPGTEVIAHKTYPEFMRYQEMLSG